MKRPKRSTLGQYLQVRREALDVSRAEVARLAETSRSTITRLEVGSTPPSAALLDHVCDALDLTVEERSEALARAGEGKGPQR